MTQMSCCHASIALPPPPPGMRLILNPNGHVTPAVSGGAVPVRVTTQTQCRSHGIPHIFGSVPKWRACGTSLNGPRQGDRGVTGFGAEYGPDLFRILTILFGGGGVRPNQEIGLKCEKQTNSAGKTCR